MFLFCFIYTVFFQFTWSYSFYFIVFTSYVLMSLALAFFSFYPTPFIWFYVFFCKALRNFIKKSAT